MCVCVRKHYKHDTHRLLIVFPSVRMPVCVVAGETGRWSKHLIAPCSSVRLLWRARWLLLKTTEQYLNCQSSPRLETEPYFLSATGLDKSLPAPWTTGAKLNVRLVLRYANKPAAEKKERKHERNANCKGCWSDSKAATCDHERHIRSRQHIDVTCDTFYK